MEFTKANGVQIAGQHDSINSINDRTMVLSKNVEEIKKHTIHNTEK